MVNTSSVSASKKAMGVGNRRKEGARVFPRYEDSGLFRNKVISIDVKLVPVFKENRRKDLVVKGFVDKDKPIEVLFAGRRKLMVDDLLIHLNARRPKSGGLPRSAQSRSAAGGGLKVRIHGSWRPRFVKDEEGWETRFYHLIAAEWDLMLQDGSLKRYGTPPVF